MEAFDSIDSLIQHAFQAAQTAVLPFDRICQIIESPDLFLTNAADHSLIPTSSIPKRQIMQALQTSESFVSAGSSKSGRWALRPKTLITVSDSSIASSIEQMLSSNGPMNVGQIAVGGSQNITDAGLFQRYLSIYSSEFTINQDGLVWFANQPLPERSSFQDMAQALKKAFSMLNKPATAEELFWCLSISTIADSRATKKDISAFLVQNPDLYSQIERGRFLPAAAAPPEPPKDDGAAKQPKMVREESFDADEFFNNPSPFVL